MGLVEIVTHYLWWMLTGTSAMPQEDQDFSDDETVEMSTSLVILPQRRIDPDSWGMYLYKSLLC